MIYEATIQYITIDKNGNDRSKKESFVVENQNFFAEVENALHNEFEVYTDLDVIAIKRSKIKEVANEKKSDDDKIYLATLCDIFHDDNDEEREIKYTIAFFAKDMDAAHLFIRQFMQQGYSMTLKQIKESKLIDVIR